MDACLPMYQLNNWIWNNNNNYVNIVDDVINFTKNMNVFDSQWT
jgi:hypothetical protein